MGLDFVGADGGGKEEVYATLTLARRPSPTWSSRSGEDRRSLLEGEHRALCDVGLRAEKIEFRLKGEGGKVTSTYDRTKHVVTLFAEIGGRPGERIPLREAVARRRRAHLRHAARGAPPGAGVRRRTT